MPGRLARAAVAALTVASCGMPLFKVPPAPPKPPPPPPAPPAHLFDAPRDTAAGSEYAVYRFVIAQAQAEHGTLLLHDSVWAHSAPGVPPDPRLVRYDSSLAADFSLANQIGLKLLPDSLKADSNVIFVPVAPDVQRALRRRHVKHATWLLLSRVGFNADHTLAAVLVATGGIGCSRYAVLARLPGRGWTVWEWVSISCV